MNRRAAQVVAAACLLCGGAGAAPAPPAAPSRPGAPTEIVWLLGRWQGPGTFIGRPSTARLELRPVLGGAFVELRYRVVTADGAAPFEGRAFYRREAEGWRARWFDSRGTSFPVTARLSGPELVADWGTPQSERGRTLYRLGADGSLLVTDAVSGVDGGWREFARHRLVLQK